MLSRYETITPESLGAPKGFSHGLLGPAGGRTLFVAGQTALDIEGNIVKGGFVLQFKKALENVLAVVVEAGGEPSDIGRMTVFVTDIETYLASVRSLGEVYRNLMGRHFPAMALVEVSRLVDGPACVEIEATAILAPDAKLG